MKFRKLITLVLIVPAVLVISFLLRKTIPTLDSLELKTVDWRFEWRGVEDLSDSPVVIVAIDDQSFEALPERWPWPRSYYARVVRNLNRAGAKAIGIDVIFDSPDEQYPERDRELAEAIQERGNVVMAGKLEQTSRLRSYFAPLEPIELFKTAADGSVGLVSIQSDGDGIYRRYPVAQLHQERFWPAFGIELLRKYVGYSNAVELEPDVSNSAFRFGDYDVPLFEQNTLLIDYAGPDGTFPTYSFSNVMDDAEFDLGEEFDLNYFDDDLLPDGVFKDKIVLIGSTVAELHDNFPTPFLEHRGTPREMPGVEIHANALNSILSNGYYQRINPMITLAMLLVALGIILFLVVRFNNLWVVLFSSVALVLGYNLLQVYLFTAMKLVGDMVFPTLAMVLGLVTTNVYQRIELQKEKRKLLGAFQQYLPEKVIDELLEQPDKLQLGGEERFLSVIFTDVAGFTTISEVLKPQELVVLLTEYLTEMTEIVFKYDGIIDKYEGDAIMAEFGAPVFYEEHAVNACLCALEMQEKLLVLGKKWRSEGKPVLTCRAGINSGNMVIGNMGSKKVFDYTVLGDEVNLAARLEGANKEYGTKNMISESTYQLVKRAVVARPLDLIRVKGKRKPVQVFELMARKNRKIDERILSMLPIYNNGIKYYQAQNWEKAAECFRYCLRLLPTDGPSRVYMKRINDFAINPPPLDWDGVYTMTTK
ncbi:MAG: CHASE2 domain-containing protein [Calditrichia bacterium]